MTTFDELFKKVKGQEIAGGCDDCKPFSDSPKTATGYGC
jgi:hypothetical protein